MDTLPEASGIVIRELSYNQIVLEISGEASDFQAVTRWKGELKNPDPSPTSRCSLAAARTKTRKKRSN
jgi:hypothetical protein